MTEVSKARPASTVVLLRDGPEGVETLLLKRNKALAFAGGFWVFPGGSLDPEDLTAANGDEAQASRIAAAREAHEEAGLKPELEHMVQLSHWTTPEIEPKRFSTWIYAAPLEADDEVVIDGGEIHESRWLPINQALLEHEEGRLGILPPTYITLRRLASYDTVAELVLIERERPVPHVMPVLCKHEGCLTALFSGDAGYETNDPAATGARHRAVREEGSWHYIHCNTGPDFPSLIPAESAA